MKWNSESYNHIQVQNMRQNICSMWPMSLKHIACDHLALTVSSLQGIHSNVWWLQAASQWWVLLLPSLSHELAASFSAQWANEFQDKYKWMKNARRCLKASQLLLWKYPVHTCLISIYLFCSISDAFSESRGLHVARQYSMYLYIKGYALEDSKIKSNLQQRRKTRVTPFQPILSITCLCACGWSCSTTGMHLDNVACYSLYFEVALSLSAARIEKL